MPDTILDASISFDKPRVFLGYNIQSIIFANSIKNFAQKNLISILFLLLINENYFNLLYFQNSLI